MQRLKRFFKMAITVSSHFKKFLIENHEKIILENTSPIENDIEKLYKFLVITDTKNELICTNFNVITKYYINIIKMKFNINGNIEYDFLKFDIYKYLQYFKTIFKDFLDVDLDVEYDDDAYFMDDLKIFKFWFYVDVRNIENITFNKFNTTFTYHILGGYQPFDNMCVFQKIDSKSYEQYLKKFKKKNNLLNKSDNDVVDYIKNRIKLLEINSV